MDLQIAGKSAIVCGSSRGLGKACALALAKEGVNVWLTARNQQPLDSAAEEIRKLSSGKVHSVVADVTTDEGREALLNLAEAGLGWRTNQDGINLLFGDHVAQLFDATKAGETRRRSAFFVLTFKSKSAQNA